MYRISHKGQFYGSKYSIDGAYINLIKLGIYPQRSPKKSQLDMVVRYDKTVLKLCEIGGSLHLS